MEIVQLLVSDIGKVYQKSEMTDPVRQAYESYVETHLKWLSEWCANADHLKNDIHHLYLLVDDKIIGFRYFYFPSKGKYCELFAVFIDPNYRKKGFASKLIEQSIDFSNKKGITKFVVRISVDNKPYKEGLLSFYDKLCEKRCPPNQLTIYSSKGKREYGL